MRLISRVGSFSSLSHRSVMSTTRHKYINQFDTQYRIVIVTMARCHHTTTPRKAYRRLTPLCTDITECRHYHALWLHVTSHNKRTESLTLLFHRHACRHTSRFIAFSRMQLVGRCCMPGISHYRRNSRRMQRDGRTTTPRFESLVGI